MVETPRRERRRARPPACAPRAPRRKVFQHPGRVAIVVVALLVVLNLGIVLLDNTDTSPGRRQPAAGDGRVGHARSRGRSPDRSTRSPSTSTTASPACSSSRSTAATSRSPRTSSTASSSSGQLSFRPGPGKEITTFPQGENDVVVHYWSKTPDRRPSTAATLPGQADSVATSQVRPDLRAPAAPRAPRRTSIAASGVVGRLEREHLVLGPDAGSGGEVHELLRVRARHVGHRAQAPLVPEELVGHRRDVTHVDAGQADRAAGAHGRQRDRHELAGGREHDGTVARVRAAPPSEPPTHDAPSSRASSRWPSPRVSTTTSQPQCCSTWSARCADAPNPSSATRSPGCTSARRRAAVADDARAQQRRRFEVVERPAGSRTANVLRHRDVVGVPAVDGPSGEVGGDAEVLLSATAELADAARVMEPGDADPVADREALATRRRARRPRRRPGGRARSAACGSSRSPSTTCRSVRQQPHACTRTRTSSGAGSGTARSTSVERSRSRSAPKRSVAAPGSRDRHLGHGTTKVASPLIAAPPDSTRVQSSSTSTLRSPASSYRRVTVPEHTTVSPGHTCSRNCTA